MHCVLGPYDHLEYPLLLLRVFPIRAETCDLCFATANICYGVCRSYLQGERFQCAIQPSLLF